jgi:hypothetical protein
VVSRLTPGGSWVVSGTTPGDFRVGSGRFPGRLQVISGTNTGRLRLVWCFPGRFREIVLYLMVRPTFFFCNKSNSGVLTYPRIS